MNDQQIFSVSWVYIFPIVLIQHPSIVTQRSSLQCVVLVQFHHLSWYFEFWHKCPIPNFLLSRHKHNSFLWIYRHQHKNLTPCSEYVCRTIIKCSLGSSKIFMFAWSVELISTYLFEIFLYHITCYVGAIALKDLQLH